MHLSSYLEKFRRMVPPQNAMRRFVRESVYEKTGIEITEERISIQNKIIFLNAHPVEKNEIALCKAAIVKDIKEKFPNQHIRDIR